MISMVLTCETSVLKQVKSIHGAEFTHTHAHKIGMFAIRAERDYVINEDFMKAVRKVGDNKKLETKMDYKNV